MPSTLTSLKVFIASPGGLPEERRAFREEIDDYNHTEALSRGVLFRAIGWEDTLGGVGRPQSIINDDLRNCDYFVLVLWNRWGSPPDRDSPRFSSGTEEEYQLAFESFSDPDLAMRQLVLMFKAVELQQISDPGPQLKRVLDFRSEIEADKSHLFHSFDSTERFRKLLRQHLGAWLRDEEASRAQHNVPMVEAAPMSDSLVDLDTVSGKGMNGSDETRIGTAWALADQGRLTEAEVEFAKRTVGGRDPGALTEYAAFLLRVGRLDQAQVLLEHAAAVASDRGDQAALSRALNGLGGVRYLRGEYESAEEMYRKALAIDEKLGHQQGIANAYGNLGKVLNKRGDLDGAEEMYRKALAIDEKLGHQRGMAASYGDLGVVLSLRRDLDGAEEMHRKALAINEKLGRLQGIANDYGNLGNVLRRRNDLDGAEELYRKALAIDEKLGRQQGIANSYGNLGNVLRVRKDLDGAEKMYRKALAIDEKLGRLEGMALSYRQLGNILRVRKDLDGAEELYRKALAIDEKLGRLEGMALSYRQLGNILRVRKDLDGAEELYRKALAIDENLGRLEGMALSYRHLGNILRVRKDLDGAEELYRKALAIDENLGRGSSGAKPPLPQT